jgi:hypothetical protein
MPPAPRAVRFASRIDLDQEPNSLATALARRRAAGSPILDLTASNPTQVGLRYPEAEILAALAAPARWPTPDRGPARAAISATTRRAASRRRRRTCC